MHENRVHYGIFFLHPVALAEGGVEFYEIP